MYLLQTFVYCTITEVPSQADIILLNRRSDREIGDLVSELTDAECSEICCAMDMITKHLS